MCSFDNKLAIITDYKELEFLSEEVNNSEKLIKRTAGCFHLLTGFCS